MDIMEQLLCPQISMDVDDAPLELDPATINSTPLIEDDDDDELSEEDKLKLLLETPCCDPSQTPEDLTPEEEAFKNTLFSNGPAVQFMKLHCTSCNVHLGSAPINQFDRYIHPLLHVLLCKECYDFYCSGDFDKDEDGSELYCRWCGQGGRVMCCFGCSYVFCQKCVRSNLGKKPLEAIKNSEDWRCFVCNPQQLLNLKLICHSLYQFVQNEINTAKTTNNIDRLKVDHTFCCVKNRVPNIPKQAMKRRLSDDPDDTYVPSKKRKKSILNKVLSTFKPLKPAPLSTQQQPLNIVPNISQNALNNIPSGLPKYLKVKVLPRQLYGNQTPTQPPATRPPIVLCTTTQKPVTNAAIIRGSQNFIPPPGTYISTPNTLLNKTQVVNMSMPTSIVPGIKHQWFDKASSITSTINLNLSRKLASFTIEQRNAKSIEQLANIHNKLQELLSSSVNSLIQVRKNLRNEFLTDLKKIKSSQANRNNRITEVKRNPPGREDDVILINEDDEPKCDPLDINAVLDVKNTNGPVIKVRSQNSLMQNPTVNGTLPPIDLCDDDDDVQITNSIPESISIDDDDDEPEAVSKPTSNITAEKPEEVFCKETVEEQSSKLNEEVDPIIKLQIQRALAESKFEAIVEENLKTKVQESLVFTKQEFKCMLSVRVIVNPRYKPNKKKVLPAVETEAIDFEEVLSGSIVLNTSGSNNINKTKSPEQVINEDTLLNNRTSNTEIIQKEKENNINIDADNMKNKHDILGEKKSNISDFDHDETGSLKNGREIDPKEAIEQILESCNNSINKDLEKESNISQNLALQDDEANNATASTIQTDPISTTDSGIDVDSK